MYKTLCILLATVAVPSIAMAQNWDYASSANQGGSGQQSVQRTYQQQRTYQPAQRTYQPAPRTYQPAQRTTTSRNYNTSNDDWRGNNFDDDSWFGSKKLGSILL